MYQAVHNVEATPDIPRRLPRGTHGLDPSLVAASQRTPRGRRPHGRRQGLRGHDDRGHRARRRRLEEDLYEHFADKLDCFLAATRPQATMEHVRARREAAGDGATQPSTSLKGLTSTLAPRTRAGIHAYLRWLAAEPALRASSSSRSRQPARRARASRAAARSLRRAHARATGREQRARRDLPRRGRRRGRSRRAPPPRGRRPPRARADPALPPGLAARGARRPPSSPRRGEQLDQLVADVAVPVHRKLLEAGEVEHPTLLPAHQPVRRALSAPSRATTSRAPRASP